MGEAVEGVRRRALTRRTNCRRAIIAEAKSHSTSICEIRRKLGQHSRERHWLAEGFVPAVCGPSLGYT